MSDGLGTYLDMLAGAEPAGGLLEVRHRRTDRGGFGQTFWPWPGERAPAMEAIRRLGRETDCYLGAAPRRRRHGGRAAVENVHVVWADCDEPEAVAALEHFSPVPSMVVRSGSGKHAYWSIWPPVGPDDAELANRRLAHHLGADPSATDAARILRPPGTANFKSGEPVPVAVERLEVEVYFVDEVVGDLPDPEPRRREPRQTGAIALAGDDPLSSIAPATYVLALTGRAPGWDRKVTCPFHGNGEERSASLHVFDRAAEGWYCFACREGGTVIDLAAKLWGVEPRGAGYHDLRRRVAAALLGTGAAA